MRYHSCYCGNCIVEEEERCANKIWLDEWKEVELCRDGNVAATRQATEVSILDQDTASHIADFAVNGSTVAIGAHDDAMYHFYLLKGTSNGIEELDHDFIDDYHSAYQKGNQVLIGHFYGNNSREKSGSHESSAWYQYKQQYDDPFEGPEHKKNRHIAYTQFAR